ncbi:MAG TPA: glycerophosphodiester phosphodiesterase [Thermoanaerobaculia bacterium]|jgi:glycerophosphoryl diester phosphodiesterase|nr:glycerophosphodiester phosphodiesterase [Thermoanaerobaculia bacterium]
MDRFLVLGHRGSPKRFPENTIASFEETLRAGADGFETDLRLLSDRSTVLFHDDELSEDEIESLTFTQCVERGTVIERLSDLSRFADRAMMVLEVKRPRWEETLLEQVSAWPNIVIASFDHTVVTELRRRSATVPLGITVYGYIVDVASYTAGIGATWIFPKYRYVDAEMVAACHDRGIRVMPWTANRKHDWERLREVGCDGVITDFPGECVVWRDELKIEN